MICPVQVLRVANLIKNQINIHNIKRIWCSGIIVPSHGTDQGSIPWMRISFSDSFLSFVFG